ncbi:uncharacterized protein LOC143372177 [Andrena cerasifolii]|uniref:uncharacterized protein LOC143372177 n=1 Tax=Andrena cerasifolii TaxID=2819439 RepID=UPI004037E107
MLSSLDLAPPRNSDSTVALRRITGRFTVHKRIPNCVEAPTTDEAGPVRGEQNCCTDLNKKKKKKRVVFALHAVGHVNTPIALKVSLFSIRPMRSKEDGELGSSSATTNYLFR